MAGTKPQLRQKIMDRLQLRGPAPVPARMLWKFSNYARTPRGVLKLDKRITMWRRSGGRYGT